MAQYLQLTFDHLGTPGCVSVVVDMTGDPDDVGLERSRAARITYPGPDGPRSPRSG